MEVMGTKRPTLYRDDDLADILEAKREELGMSVAQAADAAGIGTWSWYKKAGGSTPFSVEEIGRFAATIGAPSGWPFIEWSAGKWLERETKKGR